MESNKSEIPDIQKSFQQNIDLWKTFGRDSLAGKLLYQLYHPGRPPLITYPKLRIKPPSEQKEQPKPLKPCPQKTKIEYPKVVKKLHRKLYPIDLIPKKKRIEKIQEEIESYYKHAERPINKGIDRKQEITQLQKKFQFSKGILPNQHVQLNKKEIRQLQYDAIEKLYEKDQEKWQKQEQQRKQDEQWKQLSPQDKLKKLQYDILKEIDERQCFLQSIQQLKDKELKEKIKNQIIERASELQTINEMMQKLQLNSTNNQQQNQQQNKFNEQNK